jgi:hypothetical protein
MMPLSNSNYLIIKSIFVQKNKHFDDSATLMMWQKQLRVYLVRNKEVELWEGVSNNLVPRVFLVVARELRKTLVKYDEISKILGDLSHAQ